MGQQDPTPRLRDELAAAVPERAARAVAPAKAKARRKGKARTGRRLFQHDRALGVRWVAGADEAGRGCLAGPLVAAAVRQGAALRSGDQAREPHGSGAARRWRARSARVSGIDHGEGPLLAA